MVFALSNELTSWQVDVRIRCSQLLCAVALHAEHGFTQHLQGIFPAMYTSARDEDNRVVENISKASELIGLFVPYETWKKLIIPTIEDGPHYGHLIVLSGLIRGSPPEESTEDILEEISKVLSDESICWSRKARYQCELIECVKAIISKLNQQKNIKSTTKTNVDLYLFIIIISVVALKDRENVNIDLTLLENLSEALTTNLTSTRDVWSKNLPELLRRIKRDPKAWTIVSPERCIFEIIILESKETFGENLQEIGEILTKTLDPDTDAESRLKTFIALSKAFKTKEILFRNSESSELSEFLEKLVLNVFVPSLVWHAGATAEAMRTMAASCLLSALNPTQECTNEENLDEENSTNVSETSPKKLNVNLFDSVELLRNVWKQLQPLLISLGEDSSSKSRALALENLVAFKEILCGTAMNKSENVNDSAWLLEDLLKIYPEVLKRLDDPTEWVRICAIKALFYIFQNCPNGFKETTYKAHQEMVLDTLLTHFDDDDQNFQENALKVFKVFGNINREMLVERVNRHRPVLRNQEGCQRILESLK